MPIYTYRELNSGIDVEVIRSFADYEKPPEGDEIPESIRDKECKWERLIGENTRVVKGNGWGAGKGFWLVLLGSYVCILMQNWLV